jgi:hypothetical protein
MDTIVIVNRSSVPDGDIENILPALQSQVSDDFAPIWKIDATIKFAGINDRVIPDDYWPLIIYDHTDTPGAGGYHTDDKGRVSGKAFWLDAVQAGEAPSVDVSHEMLEMLADPTTRTLVELQGQWSGYQCLQEVCDAVEADALAYSKLGIDGKPVMLSDFCTPTYFKPIYGLPSGYDFCGKLLKPAPALLQGGYLGILNQLTGQWQQVSDFDLATATRSRRSLRHGRTQHAIATLTKSRT